MNAFTFVQKRCHYCNMLLVYGLSYGDHVEQFETLEEDVKANA